MARRLTEAERDAIIGLYEGRYASGPPGPSTVGWSSREQQYLRFDVLLRGLEPKGAKVLDVGCGLADLVPYLDARTGGDFDYVGIDLAPSLVQDAHRRLGTERRRFYVGDILEPAPHDRDLEADLVLLSGALNYRIADNIAHAESMLRRMYELARDAACANFLSTRVDYEEPRNFHYPPGRMLEIAGSIARWTTLLHDYPLWEFTLQLRHEPVGGGSA